MSIALTANELHELTGYKIGTKQCAWIRSQLGLDPPVGADGRPRVTKEVVDHAMLARRTGQPHTDQPSDQPKWTK